MHFDANYYQRFYLDPATRATTPAEQRRQARFIGAFVRHLGLPVERIADIGCGLGTVLTELGKLFPKAKLTGVEYSDYLCQTYGWTQASVVDFKAPPFDLLVCNDVLGYLNDSDCSNAITNLAHLSSGALYLSVLTTEDQQIIDEQHTDMTQQKRTFRWYKKRLDRYFVTVGGGLFLRKPCPVPLWRLEHL